MGMSINFWLILLLAVVLLGTMVQLMRAENIRVELEQSQKRLRIIDALSTAYVAIMLVQLREHTVEVLKSSKGAMHGYKSAMTSDGQQAQIDRLAAEPYKKQVQEFCDMATVEQRLKERSLLTCTWQTAAGGWMLTVIVPQRYDAYGSLMAVLVANRDVTEEKSRELEARQLAEQAAEEAHRAQLAAEAAKLEADRANAAKTDFLRRMSHDVRTPINGIRGMVEVSRHCVGDEARQEECRQKIMDASGFLLDLVNNVLDMNKLESGEIQLEEKPFDLARMVQEVNSVIEVQARERGITVDCQGVRGTHTRFIGSPVHLRQVLQNISTNAIKYTNEGGHVELCARETGVENGCALYEFVCTDNGIGVSEEFQRHAFEPFAQEDASARTAYSGTGLGLAITKELVDRMQGTITFESALHKGTTFHIRLPLRIDTARLLAKPAVQALDGKGTAGMHVLLVEDNELNMEIVQFLLESGGVVLTKAWNGRQAVEQFATSAPGTYDAILMDIMMPVMNGLDAARAIRAMNRPDAAAVPIFAMTANAFQDDIQRSRAASMNEHLTKPLERDKLLHTLQKYRAKTV